MLCYENELSYDCNNYYANDVEDILQVKPKTVRKKKVNKVDIMDVVVIVPQTNWVIQQRNTKSFYYDAKLVYHRLYHKEN